MSVWGSGGPAGSRRDTHPHPPEEPWEPAGAAWVPAPPGNDSYVRVALRGFFVVTRLGWEAWLVKVAVHIGLAETWAWWLH